MVSTAAAAAASTAGAAVPASAGCAPAAAAAEAAAASASVPGAVAAAGVAGAVVSAGAGAFWLHAASSSMDSSRAIGFIGRVSMGLRPGGSGSVRGAQLGDQLVGDAQRIGMGVRGDAVAAVDDQGRGAFDAAAQGELAGGAQPGLDRGADHRGLGPRRVQALLAVIPGDLVDAGV